jgi:hypothetical protein
MIDLDTRSREAMSRDLQLTYSALYETQRKLAAERKRAELLERKIRDMRRAMVDAESLVIAAMRDVIAKADAR